MTTLDKKEKAEESLAETNSTLAIDSDESAWPLRCIVEKLIEAADILLDEKDYDGHGHELISFARNEACNWLRQNAEVSHERL